MRLIRWTGHVSPFDDIEVKKRLFLGHIRMADLERLRKMDRQRVVAIPGHSRFVVGPEHGFSQTYEFGPRVFERWMDDADVALFFKHPKDRAMFRDVTDVPGVAGPEMPQGGADELVDTFVDPLILARR